MACAYVCLALLNPEVAAQTWGIKAILRGLLKCSHPRISESVVLTLSHLLNTPCTRRYIRSQLDVEVGRGGEREREREREMTERDYYEYRCTVAVTWMWFLDWSYSSSGVEIVLLTKIQVGPF